MRTRAVWAIWMAGACVAAAGVAAVISGLALVALLFGTEVSNDVPAFLHDPLKLLGGFVEEAGLFALLSLMWGFVPALSGAAAVLLPLHLILVRTGRTARRWYLAAGCITAALTLLAWAFAYGSLDRQMRDAGLGLLLAAVLIGGPVAALLFRRLAPQRLSAVGP